MIQSIFIKNFKAFERETFPIEQHNIIIGENDAGKSTILEAVDVFFNLDKVDKACVRNLGEPVEIAIRYNDKQYKKIYSGATYKLTSEEGNMDDIEHLKYIYIPVGNYDVKKLIQDLAIANAKNNTSQDMIDELKLISQTSLNEVINSIDPEMLIINNQSTNIVGEEKFKYEGSLKFDVTCDGVDLDVRGSGYKKNMMYALLIGNTYENVILGIDEIENSFSVNNSKNMLSKIYEKIGQTIITTHSNKIIEVCGNAKIYPILSESNKSLADLLKSMDSTNTKKYLLVEGKYDINWIKKCLDLKGKLNDYIVLPSGGDGNVDNLKNELILNGKECIIIKDGDTNDPLSVSRECIELYAPLEALNEILELELTSVPTTKDTFFSEPIINDIRNKDTVKDKLSRNIERYLTIDNPLVEEVDNLLSQ